MARARRELDSQPDWVLLARPDEAYVDPSTSLGFYISDPGPVEFESHVHESMELGIVMAGRKEAHFGSYRLVAEPGDVWFYSMWEPHGWRNSADHWGVMFYFLPRAVWDPLDGDPSWLPMFSCPPEQRPKVTTPQLRMSVLRLGHEIVSEAREQRRGWLRMGRLALLRLLVLLDREWRPPPGRDALPQVAASDVTRVQAALTLVHSNLGRRVPAQEAAASCGLSASRFQNIFRRAMGLSYGRFELRARLAAAAQRLIQTGSSIDDIAEATGFTDGSHLHHAFPAQYGCTPADYRRHAGGGPRVLVRMS